MTTKGIPSVPDVPAQLSEDDIYRILEPLKRIIDIRQGQFDPLDRWVTQQDLIDAGLQTEGAVTSPVTIIPPTQQYQVSFQGDIVAGPDLFGTGANVFVDTIINLPNVTEIDGGDAAETFPGSTQGPYGVVGGGGGGGSALTVEDDGTALTTDATKLNFVGFTITEPTADEITISTSAAAAANEFCPGHTIVYVDADTFRVDGINVTSVYYPGRYLVFRNGATNQTGKVASSSFAGGNTTIDMTMDPSNNIQSDVNAVCVISDGSSWAPIAADPFNGGPIRDIATGAIGGTQWWVIIGDGGNIATSTDGGVTWTTRTLSTYANGDLKSVVYCPKYQGFLVAGAAGSTTNSAGIICWASTDGTTWSQQYFNPLTGNYFNKIIFNEFGDYAVGITQDNSSYLRPGFFTGTTDVRGSSPGALFGATNNYTTNGADDNWYWAQPTSIFWRYDNENDTSDSSTGSGVSPISAMRILSTGAVTSRLVIGDSSGRITNSAPNFIDDSTFSNAIREFAISNGLDLAVCVGDNATIGYLDNWAADFDTNDAWTAVTNGFAPTANILSVDYNETDGVFVAVADNGQIARSSNGIN